MGFFANFLTLENNNYGDSLLFRENKSIEKLLVLSLFLERKRSFLEFF